jgi:hypothetical protein
LCNSYLLGPFEAWYQVGNKMIGPSNALGKKKVLMIVLATSTECFWGGHPLLLSTNYFLHLMGSFEDEN